MLRLPPAPTALREDPSNRLGLDFAAEATRFPKLGYGIIDMHAHINGVEASAVWEPIASAYGVEKTLSMTRLEDVPLMRERFGDAIEFITIPDWHHADKRHGHGTDYLARIESYREQGAKIVKFWNAPRFIDFGLEAGDKHLLALDGEMRVEQMRLAERLGMICMTHVADPDTWFAAKYTDRAKYGAKLDHYAPLRRALDRFAMPWIAAHMGGFPEDLGFLDRLLEAHPNLHLDTRLDVNSGDCLDRLCRRIEVNDALVNAQPATHRQDTGQRGTTQLADSGNAQIQTALSNETEQQNKGTRASERGSEDCRDCF